MPHPSLLRRIFKFLPFSKLHPSSHARFGDSISLESDDESGHTYCNQQATKRNTLPSRIFQLARPVLRRLEFIRIRNPRSVPLGESSTKLNIGSHGTARPLTPSTADSTTSQSPITASTQILEDRAIRDEQDNALRLALEQDRRRVEAAREAERLAEEAEDRIQKQAQLKKEREEREEAHKNTQIAWRRWARRALVPDTPDYQSVNIAVRLPSGARREGRLPPSATLQTLHILAETFLIPADCAKDEDPAEPPEGYSHEHEFKLVWTSPRVVLSDDADRPIGNLEILRRGVLLIMEEIGSEDLGFEYDSESEYEPERG